MEDFDSQTIARDRLAIFITATYGEGEPTDNAKIFYNWLKNVSESNSLSTLSYCVFGLGNRQYENFNRMGKFVDGKLSELGAIRVVPLGLGDDDQSLEEDFERWRQDLWPILMSKFSPAQPRGSVAAKPDDMHKAATSAAETVEEAPYERINLRFEAVPCIAGPMKTLSSKAINSSSKYFFTSSEVCLFVYLSPIYIIYIYLCI